MTLVINRPCGTCSHAVVCRIRAELEAALVNATFVPPASNPALEYDVTVDMSCAHFLPSVTTETPAFYSSKYASDIPECEESGEAVETDTNLPGFLERTLGPVAEPELEPEALTVEPPETGPKAPLTPRQKEILDAYRQAGGDAGAAATSMGLTEGAIRGTLYQLRAGGRLPADVEELVEKRRRPARVPVRDAHNQIRAEADAQRIAQGIAERSRAAAPDVLEARDADDSRHRERARAKADETWRQRHGQA